MLLRLPATSGLHPAPSVCCLPNLTLASTRTLKATSVCFLHPQINAWCDGGRRREAGWWTTCLLANAAAQASAALPRSLACKWRQLWLRTALVPTTHPPTRPKPTPAAPSRFARQSQPRVVTTEHEQGPLVYFDALLHDVTPSSPTGLPMQPTYRWAGWEGRRRGWVWRQVGAGLPACPPACCDQGRLQ